jgi:molybdenum cofactor sulfurtransferase
MLADTGHRVLEFFNADPAHFDVLFTANATAIIKLVADALSKHEAGFDYDFDYKCHTSSLRVGRLVKNSICLTSGKAVASWIESDSD